MPGPDQLVRGGLLYVHPFAEELNCSRRMAAIQSRAFAQAGYAVLQMDLHGCGDSEGDLSATTWATWVSDVSTASNWMEKRVGVVPWLWGLRAGCLLVAEVARSRSFQPSKMLMWQPVTSGQLHLNQFLRLKFVTDLLHGKRGAGVDTLLNTLAEGTAIEVAGYMVSPQVANGLMAASLDGIPQHSIVKCVEFAGGSIATVSPALSAQLSRWHTAGCAASAEIVNAAPFWQSPEALLSDAVLEVSLRSVAERVSAP